MRSSPTSRQAGGISQLAMSAMNALEQRSASTIEQALYAQLAELRTGLLPFRLDPTAPEGDDLYVPGTAYGAGYGEMPSDYGYRSMP
jgi:hypothetical protein